MNKRQKTLAISLIWALLLLVGPMAGISLAADTKSTGFRVVTDMAGRKVTIPTEVKSVVTAGGTPAINAFIFALGKAATIRNGMPISMHGKRWKFQTVFAPNLLNEPVVSGPGPAWVPDIESLMTLPHDLILVDSRITAQKLEEKGFKVAYLNWKDRDSILKTMRLLGEIFNQAEKAKSFERYYHKVEKRIAVQVSNVPQRDRPKVLYCRFSSFMLPMLSTTSILIEKTGGIPATGNDIKQDNAAFSPEQMINWNPDILIVWSPEEVASVYHDKRLSSLNAVRTRRVYSMPMGAHVWSHFTPEQPLAMLWLAKKLYPQKFREVNIEKEMSYFYKKFMKHSLSKEQILEILGES